MKEKKNTPSFKTLLRRMIKRIEQAPESYDQRTFYGERDSGTPCGAVACLAGEGVICLAPTVKQGVRKLLSGQFNTDELASILRLPTYHGVFAANNPSWPSPFKEQLAKAKSRQAQAQVAVAYLKEAIKRDTMIW